MAEKAFNPHLDILPKQQRILWPELADVPPDFTLYGGTAVALHLGHRVSVDFDFFGKSKFKPRELMQLIPFLRDAQITQTEPNTLSVIVDRKGPVKISFFGVPALRQLAKARVAKDTGLKVASLLDLAAAKISVIIQRAEVKDYHDIDAILKSGEVDLPTMIAAAKTVYGQGFHPESALKALTYFDDGNVKTLAENARRRLVKAATRVDLDKLPTVKPLPVGKKAKP